MASEQLIAELAALREKHTLDEVLELVMVGLGGKEKVAAELEEYEEDEAQDDGAGETETPDPLTVMRDADVGRLENIQFMAESFCTWLHAKGAQQMEKDTDEAVDMVRQLSTSFNKAARAVRLSMVLKHEVAGLRPLPSARAPAGPANENTAPKGRNGAPRLYGDWRDYTDEERAEYKEAEKRLEVYMRKLSDAVDIDIAAAPPEIQAKAKGQSIATKLTTVAAAISHPMLDRALADIELGKLWDSLAPRYATKPESLGPPDPEALSKRGWNAAPHQRGSAAKATQRR